MLILRSAHRTEGRGACSPAGIENRLIKPPFARATEAKTISEALGRCPVVSRSPAAAPLRRLPRPVLHGRDARNWPAIACRHVLARRSTVSCHEHPGRVDGMRRGCGRRGRGCRRSQHRETATLGQLTGGRVPSTA